MCSCQGGSFLYACSNVLQETMVKDRDPREFLGMLGINGAVVSAAQMSLFEVNKVLSSSWNGATISFTAGYVVCLFCMYSAASLFLRTSDAALFNLSLLTSDIYAVIFSYFVFGATVHWLYYVAFALTGTGLVVYSTAGPIGNDVRGTIDSLRRNVMNVEEDVLRCDDGEDCTWANS